MKRIAIVSAIGAACVAAIGLQAAAAGGTTRYVSPSGVDNATCSKSSPCRHVQAAVNVAGSGDTIQLAAGTYAEQVTIAKNVSVSGAGAGSSTIAAPPALVADGEGFMNIVEIKGGATVQMSKLAVAGPGPGTCGSISNGISVIGGASLDLTQSAVRDVRDNPLSGCQNGNAVNAGTQGSGGPAEVGHLTVDHSTVAGYQKNGITIDGAGSTGQIDHNTVQSTPTTQIASNGIQVSDGASATVDHNTVSGNECNDVPDGCGSDWFTQFQAVGILMFGAGSSSVVSHNSLDTNDIGIYTDTGVTIDHNDLGSRYFGILTDFGNSAQVDHNSTTGGNYGIFEFGGTGTFSHNSAKGNAVVDLWWDGTGTPSFDHNQCGTASPSKAAWDCK